MNMLVNTVEMVDKDPVVKESMGHYGFLKCLPLNSIAPGRGQYWNICGRRRLCHQHYLPLRSRLHDRAMRLRSIGKREFPAYDRFKRIVFKPTAIDEWTDLNSASLALKSTMPKISALRDINWRGSIRFFPCFRSPRCGPASPVFPGLSQIYIRKHFQDYVRAVFPVMSFITSRYPGARWSRTCRAPCS